MSCFDRRQFLKTSLGGLGALSLGTSIMDIASAQPFQAAGSWQKFGPLLPPNEIGLRLPAGFTARVLAGGEERVRLADRSLSHYKWHHAADGGACYPTEDGGWIYVSNCEVRRVGGAGALRFAADGGLTSAYSILAGTNMNCAGGPTPWETWLSCEEVDFGRVFECDIYGVKLAQECPALGYFKHEAVALDYGEGRAYLTEDEFDGCFYRYTSANRGRFDFSQGLLEVAVVDSRGRVTWEPLPNPNPGRWSKPTRKQVSGARKFRGGEGIWYHEGRVIFTTKSDNRVWAYHTATAQLDIIYDAGALADPVLKGVDNVTVAPDGNILVGEDGDDMQICVLAPDGRVQPIVQLDGHDGSEITGPALNHLGNRLYFSSQRGGSRGYGMTYEVSGPFFAR